MALSRRLARPLLASAFVVGGWDAFWNPAGREKRAEAVSEPLAEAVGVDELDTEMLVRINGAVQVGAGVLLAVGRFRRLAALALIGSIIPTTYAGHRFWEESDPTTRAQQKIHFLKNVGLLGGLILAAFDTEGEPSLAWRAKRQARQLESAVATGRTVSHRKAHRTGRRLEPVVTQATRRLGATGHDVAEKVTPDPETITHAHDAVAEAVKSSTGTASQAVHQAAAFVSDAARQLEPLTLNATHTAAGAVGPLLTTGTERTRDFLSKVREHLPSD